MTATRQANRLFIWFARVITLIRRPLPAPGHCYETAPDFSTSSMSIISRRQQVICTLLLFLFMLLLVPRSGNTYDMGFWVRWATHIFEHGLGNVYQLQDDTYNPFYQYILWVYAHMMGSVEKIQYYFHWLKAFPLLFDFVGAFWAASLVQERNRRFGLALMLLLNIAYVYNSIVWGQIDGIYSFFAFGAIVLAVKQRTAGSVMLYVLALATKTQAIIFLPPLLLLWLPPWWHRPRQAVQAVLAGTTLTVLLLAPFIWWSWESYLPRIIENNLGVIDIFPRLSMNCYNLWYLLVPEDVMYTIYDTHAFAGLTYHKWGLLLFFVSSGLVLLPLIVATWQSLRHAAARPTSALVLLTCGAIPLLFGFFNTQMHERYWHGAIIFLAAYAFVSNNYWPYVVGSIAYFLNLEAVLRHLELLKYGGTLLFDPRFVAGTFGLAILLAVLKIYQLAPWRIGQPSSKPTSPILASPLPLA
ncbi:hypothetical protein QMK33_03845 [Hymenobacter sp. H14-R3]|uniref:hypothetical protein n=1 Tax=Hymenobacter sp. H14-R3 TaxID=3046308 RepID=UPI0024B94036|nr:hypothetical protein [Hymenobacter sp. H14-R3]MDJ0364270.1 hypothetical protein [Hymenobacter sp. H14-R3]